MLMKHQQGGAALESETWTIDSAAETFAGLLGMLRRQSRLIAAACALGLAAGALFVALGPKKYTATASVFVDLLHPTNLSANQGAPLSIGLIDPAAVESQIDILKSERIALRAVSQLGLLKNPDLIIYQNPIRSAIAQFALRHGLASPETDFEIERSVVDTIMNNTTVERAGKTHESFVIEVSSSAQDPELAARIANGLVAAYLTDQLESRFEMAKLANDWFNRRLLELRESVDATERAAQKFKAENNINTVTGNLIDEQSLSQSEQILVTARANMADARARLEQLNQIIAAGNVQAAVQESLASPLIQRLRSELSDLMRREADLRQRKVTSDHYVIAQIRASIAETQRLIMDEFERIRSSTENEVKSEEARVRRLEQEKRNAANSLMKTKEKFIHGAELDREAAAVRSLYESFMTRFQVTTQEQSYPVSEARMVTQAQPPLKESRRKGLIVALGGALGLVLGIGAAWLRENLFTRIRAGQQLELATGAPFLGNLPAVLLDQRAEKKSAHWVRMDGRFMAIGRTQLRASVPIFSRKKPRPQALGGIGMPRPDSEKKAKYSRPTTAFPPADQVQEQFGSLPRILRYAVDEPLSRFAETMRSCKVSLQQISTKSAASVIGIVSVMPNEGKSTFSSNFAYHLAFGGYRTLLIDSDLRKPKLSVAYGAGRSRGLFQILSHQATLEDVTIPQPETKLSFVPSGVQEAVANSEELLYSSEFKSFVASARERFDFVVLDLPPLISVVDARVAAEHLDGLVLIAEWGQADPHVIGWTLKQSPGLREHLVGCVLNKVPTKEMNPYEGYY